MQKRTNILFFLSGILTPLWFSSCQVSKPLETEVRVSINESLPIKITKDAGATFITFYGEDDYRKIFLQEVKNSLALHKVIVDNTNPQFSLAFIELTMDEKTTTDTVKDEKSKDNGKIFDIAVAKLNASGTLINLNNQTSTPWAVEKSKRERITSLQSLGQVISGENKGLNEYRKKDFEKGEFVSLSGQCGQKASEEIYKVIRKQVQ